MNRQFRFSRRKQEKRGKVLLYGPTPRFATLPMSVLKTFPREAMRIVDNSALMFMASLIGAGVGSIPGVLYAVVVFFTVTTYTASMLMNLVAVPLLGAALGLFIARRWIAPMFFEGPYWIVLAREYVIGGQPKIVPEAVMVDNAIWKEWTEYLQTVKRRVAEIKQAKARAGQKAIAEEDQQSLIDPTSVEAVTARFHAGTMAAIEQMDDIAEDYAGGASKAALIAMASVAGTVAVAFIGVIVFAIVIGDQKAKAAMDGAGVLFGFA